MRHVAFHSVCTHEDLNMQDLQCVASKCDIPVGGGGNKKKKIWGMPTDVCVCVSGGWSCCSVPWMLMRNVNVSGLLQCGTVRNMFACFQHHRRTVFIFFLMLFSLKINTAEWIWFEFFVLVCGVIYLEALKHSMEASLLAIQLVDCGEISDGRTNLPKHPNIQPIMKYSAKTEIGLLT